MKFTKVHGLGNDFVLIEDTQNAIGDYAVLARKLCRRQTGVGADGLLIVQDSETCDLRMRIFNADGSEAEMCGNGIRCFAKYAYERGLTDKTDMSVETLAGVMRPALSVNGGKVISVTVNMGKPGLERSMIPAKGEGRLISEKITAAGQEVTITSVLMGVPHTIVYVKDALDCGLTVLGPAIEKHELFPRGANVDFAQLIDEKTIRMRTWERGCGPTLACGTGACACAVCSCLNGFTGREADIELELGALHIRWAEDGNVYMTGPAELVFDAEI